MPNPGGIERHPDDVSLDRKIGSICRVLASLHPNDERWRGANFMWTALLQAIGSFAAGAVAWIVLEFFGRPLRKFYDLRGETIYRLSQTANVSARFKELRDAEGEISENVEKLDISDEQLLDLKEARKALRDLASQLRAFALNETHALYFVRRLGYDPMKAGAGLYGLSNSLDTYGTGRNLHKSTIETALKIVDV